MNSAGVSEHKTLTTRPYRLFLARHCFEGGNHANQESCAGRGGAGCDRRPHAAGAQPHRRAAARFPLAQRDDVAARTSAGRFTEIGDAFSNGAGPNGRAAVMVHEAVHFIVTKPVLVDVPEWSGETVAGREWGVSDPIPGVAVSGIPYRDLTTAQAIDNPGSYAAFAQEMFFTPTQPGAADTRFGGARLHE